MLILQSWKGRLGNNIHQLSNIIDIAIAYKHNVNFKVDHPLFNLKLIEEYFNKYNNKKIDRGIFFYRGKMSYSSDIYEGNIEERNNLLKKSFLIKDINKLDEDDLIIHIRSGDIFSTCPNRAYVPPPLSYYINYINKIQHKKIIIISEDKKNPVINKLLQLYKNAEYNKRTLNHDIRIILGATKIIYSIGTFIPKLLLMSDNIKLLYGSEHSQHEELEDYYQIMKPWRNTKIQRDYILTYNYNEN